jgi:hypothetical protein
MYHLGQKDDANLTYGVGAASEVEKMKRKWRTDDPTGWSPMDRRRVPSRVRQ